MKSNLLLLINSALHGINAVGMGINSYLSFERVHYAHSHPSYRTIGYACASVALLSAVSSLVSLYELHTQTKTFIEKRLLKENEAITPITVDDYALFHQFGNGYKNTLTYNAQAVNGWSPKGRSNNRLGLKYYDGDNLFL